MVIGSRQVLALALLLCSSPASGLLLGTAARHLAARARAAGQAVDEAIYFAVSPSPFAISSAFEPAAFSPMDNEQTSVTLLFEPAAQTVVRDTVAQLGELSGFTIVKAVTTESGFMLVARGTRVALRHFMSRAAYHVSNMIYDDAINPSGKPIVSTALRCLHKVLMHSQT